MTKGNHNSVEALQYLRNNEHLTCADFRREFPRVADTIISSLKSRKAITLLTDGTIWAIDNDEVDALIFFYKSQSGFKLFLSNNWKTCLEVIGVVCTIIGIVVTCCA